MERDLQLFDKKGIGFCGSGIAGESLEFLWWRNIKGDREQLKSFCGLALAWWGIELRIGPALNETEAAKWKKIQVIGDYAGGGLYVESGQLETVRREFSRGFEQSKQGADFFVEVGTIKLMVRVKYECH